METEETDAPNKAMSSSEKMKRHREKKKNTDPNYGEKESKRVEKLRKKRVKNMNENNLKAYRAAAAVRQQKCRAKKKPTESDSTEKSKSYKSPQALGKATKKVTNALPNSPRKKREVLDEVAKKIGVSDPAKEKKSLDDMDDDTKNAVKSFYTNMDIVYTAPGMKDEVTIWEGGEKFRRRKYYLTMYLKEAHALFLERFPQHPISFSAFAKLRPANVLLMKDTPSDQCKCLQHENFMLQLAGLGTQYDNDWWKSNLCDFQDLHSSCWKGDCVSCGVTHIEQNYSDSNKAKNVSWWQWEKEENGRLKKMMKVGCFGELLELVLVNYPQFQEHVRVKRIQSNAFEEKKQTSTVIQMDFAMSYSCEYQNEVQSALWSRESVTLFTAAIFQKGECESHVIVSDSNEKTKDSIATFVRYLVLKAYVNNASEITLFSDGPSSEFKNKFMSKLLYILACEHNAPIEWQYFATSHGKGVVDGIGGRAKSLVRQAVMSKALDAPVVQNSLDFAQQASCLMPRTRVKHISKEEIKDQVEASKPWEYVISVPGIREMHVIRASPSGLVSFWHTAGVQDADMTIHYAESGKDISWNIGDWVLVRYDETVYPGEVLRIVGGETEVKVMHKTGNLWKWPEVPDMVYYTVEQVLKKIKPPEAAGHRGQFRFTDL